MTMLQELIDSLVRQSVDGQFMIMREEYTPLKTNRSLFSLDLPLLFKYELYNLDVQNTTIIIIEPNIEPEYRTHY